VMSQITCHLEEVRERTKLAQCTEDDTQNESNEKEVVAETTDTHSVQVSDSNLLAVQVKIQVVHQAPCVNVNGMVRVHTALLGQTRNQVYCVNSLRIRTQVPTAFQDHLYLSHFKQHVRRKLQITLM
jgi:hypothetical protein